MELKIADQIVWIEIELLHTEWSWDFTFVIDIFSIEKFLFCVVFKDVACVGILKITSDVGGMTSLVKAVALVVLKNDYVATIITVKLTQDVIDVESTMVSIWRHLDWMSRLIEVLDQLLRHDDLSFKSLIILIFLLLLTDDFLGHLSTSLNTSGLLLKSPLFSFLSGCFLLSFLAPLLLLKELSLLSESLLLLELLSFSENSGSFKLIFFSCESLFCLLLLAS